jgi:hypothetical protein
LFSFKKYLKLQYLTQYRTARGNVSNEDPNGKRRVLHPCTSLGLQEIKQRRELVRKIRVQIWVDPKLVKEGNQDPTDKRRLLQTAAWDWEGSHEYQKGVRLGSSRLGAKAPGRNIMECETQETHTSLSL